MLSLNNIEVAYDRVFLAVKSISIDVPEGGLVALLGANGAGKSTTLKAIIDHPRGYTRASDSHKVAIARCG